MCGCSDCVVEDRKFSKAWSTHRMRLNEKSSKRFVKDSDDSETKGSTSVLGCSTCFSNFCNLKGPDGFHWDSRDLISSFCGKLTVFRTKVATFLNDRETCSHFSQFIRYSSVVMPLLSQMSMDDSSWWLLDSGASATVLAERFATCYGVTKKSGGHNGDQFKAANGTAVNMSGRAEVGVKVVMVDEWGNQRSQRIAQLKAMVGDIQHNIISTTSLCKAGWEFWQGDTWFELRNKRTGEIASEVGYFAGCPWIRLQTCKDAKVVSFVVPEDDAKHSQLSPLTRAAEADLLKHRLQGHTPFDPRCVECARGMTAFAHRRRREGALECELQADFAYLSTRGELTDVEVDNCFKVLVLAEMASNGVANVLVKGDLTSTRTEIAKWLEHLGMSSEKSSIVLHTD